MVGSRCAKGAMITVRLYEKSDSVSRAIVLVKCLRMLAGFYTASNKKDPHIWGPVFVVDKWS